MIRMQNIAEVYTPFKKLSMTFNGDLSFELIDSMINILSKKLDELEEDVNIRRKVFGAVLECLQNLGNHVEELDMDNDRDDNNLSSVLFILEAIDEGYSITTVNFIANDKVDALKDWITFIKGLSREELRRKYNEILLTGSFTAKGGGGLGLIDIALKSGGQIYYKFQPHNKNFTLFTFKTLIKKEVK